MYTTGILKNKSDVFGLKYIPQFGPDSLFHDNDADLASGV